VLTIGVLDYRNPEDVMTKRYGVSPHWFAFSSGAVGGGALILGWMLAPWPPAYAILLGAVIAIGLGHLIGHVFIVCMRYRADLPYLANEHSTSDIVSVVERVMAFSACGLGQDIGFKIIGGWVLLKTFSKWKPWEGDGDDGRGKGRATYYVFICGTVVSVSCAIAAALFTAWLIDPSRVPEFFQFGGTIAKPLGLTAHDRPR
jgi:hypothetical protein